MLVESFFSFIKAIWNNFQMWLKQYSIWLYLHIAIRLINNLAIKWMADQIIENFRLNIIQINNIFRTTMLIVQYDIYNNEKNRKNR